MTDKKFSYFQVILFKQKYSNDPMLLFLMQNWNLIFVFSFFFFLDVWTQFDDITFGIYHSFPIIYRQSNWQNNEQANR